MLSRNIVRTFYIYLFSTWASIPVWKKIFLKQFFIPSAENLSNKGGQYKEARDNGLFPIVATLENLNFFQETDYFEPKEIEYEELIQKEIKELFSNIKRSKFQQVTMFVWMLKQPASPYGSWYGGIDKVYLLASYFFARKYGATPAEAVHWARKWLPFQKATFLPPVARVFRKSEIGQFWSILYYSIPRFLETHIIRPWVVVGTIEAIFVFIVILLLSLCIVFVGRFSGRNKTSTNNG